MHLSEDTTEAILQQILICHEQRNILNETKRRIDEQINAILASERVLGEKLKEPRITPDPTTA